jgi:hypothetical protein
VAVAFVVLGSFLFNLMTFVFATQKSLASFSHSLPALPTPPCNQCLDRKLEIQIQTKARRFLFFLFIYFYYYFFECF